MTLDKSVPKDLKTIENSLLDFFKAIRVLKNDGIRWNRPSPNIC